MTRLGRIPSAGDRVDVGPLSVEVADMDGFRVDKVLVTRRAATDVTDPA
jgi:CBS domain containing-hemolysin-like protein